MKRIWQAVILLAIASSVSVLVDEQVHTFLSAFHSSYLDTLMLFFSHLGGLSIGIPFLIIAVILLEANKKDEITMNLIAAVVIDTAVVAVLKAVIGRERPEGKNFSNLEAHLSSFPSGHSSRAFAMFNMLRIYYSRPFLFYSVASLVAFSRIYFGVHYLSDILMGAAVGIAVSETVAEKNIGKKAKKILFQKKKRAFSGKTHAKSILKAR